ncbi:MAG: cell division protein FtsL [Pseudomonadota bacterium]
MNAIAKTLNAQYGGQVKNYNPSLIFPKLNQQTFILCFLVILVFCSATMIIFVQAKDRLAFAKLSQLQNRRDNLHVRFSQLLLEQDTWAAPIRIATIATKRYKMVAPKAKQIILLPYNA